ncbi:MAG: hypothetical protein V4616_04740 [Bacteroidota bacterium]
MKNFNKSKLSLLCAVVLCGGSLMAQVGQTAVVKSPSVLTIQAVDQTKIVYRLNVQRPEFPIETLAANFREKSGILDCVTEGSYLVITTESEISKDMVIGVVKASGYRATYNAYKQELRDAIPRPPERKESR